jgi:hypothetical protein
LMRFATSVTNPSRRDHSSLVSGAASRIKYAAAVVLRLVAGPPAGASLAPHQTSKLPFQTKAAALMPVVFPSATPPSASARLASAAVRLTAQAILWRVAPEAGPETRRCGALPET